MKSIYAGHFGLRYDTEFRHDLYSQEILYEFKFNRQLKKRGVRASIIAQVLYYIRRLRYSHADKAIPPVICIADHNAAFFTYTNTWSKFYKNEKGKYDWEVAPSTPDQKLVIDLSTSKEINTIQVYNVLEESEFKRFSEALEQHRSKQLTLELREKKLITEDNFEDVFEYWNRCFGQAVKNGTKPSRYFLCDIQKERSLYDPIENKVIFFVGPTEKRAKKILPNEYELFWSNYEKVSNPDTVRNILAKVDRLTEEPIKRFTGEFFTPVLFAKKAHKYLEKAVGTEWWTKNIRLWDMAAGTGNLEWYLPSDSYKNIYLSTLHRDDVEHCKRVFPDATVFQYDYLNDDIDNVFAQGSLFAEPTKLPDNLASDLLNPEISWIIFINPPFATSQTAGTSGKSKKNVSKTKIRPLMHEMGLGEVSRELFAQFLFRIKHEFRGKQACLGLFSTLKYVTANNDQTFRDKIFKFTYKNGFIFSSANFWGTKKGNPFPVGFLVWDLVNQKKLEDQTIEVDVLDDDSSKLARKLITSEHRSQFLSKWIERPDATEKFPPFGGAISIKSNNEDTRDRVAPGFLASLMCKGNDVQNYNNVALLSGPYVSAGSLSITEGNFDKAMVVHAVRKNVKKTWINDRDQFLQPRKQPSVDFVKICTVWNLFSDSNQTASLRNVDYLGNTYQIVNHFYPFRVATLSHWIITDSEIKRSLTKDPQDRFVALWLDSQRLDPQSQNLIKIGKEVYKSFYANFKDLPTAKYKIEHWDAGWWQIRKCMIDAGLESSKFVELEDLQKKLGLVIYGSALDLGIISSI